MVVFSIVILVFPWVASEIPKHIEGRDESRDSFSQGFEQAQIFSERNFPPTGVLLGRKGEGKNGTLHETNSSHQPGSHPKRKGSSYNHPFSGAMLVLGMVDMISNSDKKQNTLLRCPGYLVHGLVHPYISRLFVSPVNRLNKPTY